MKAPTSGVVGAYTLLLRAAAKHKAHIFARLAEEVGQSAFDRLFVRKVHVHLCDAVWHLIHRFLNALSVLHVTWQLGKLCTLVCANCDAGMYSASGASVCTLCAAGRYSAAGASVCLVCAAGMFAELSSEMVVSSEIVTYKNYEYRTMERSLPTATSGT